MIDNQTLANERRRQKTWAAASSTLAAVVLTSAKLAAALLTGSLGILSEALHSGVDLAGTLLSLAAVRVSERPPDATHPYGHAKFESLAALVAVGLLSVTALGILREAASRILETHVVPVPNPLGFGVMLLSILVDFTRSRYLRRVATRFGSQALAADATHFATDLFSSIAVLVGLGVAAVGNALNWPREILAAADAFAAAIVALIILTLAAQLAIRAVNSLTDRLPPHLLSEVVKAVENTPDTVGKAIARVHYVGDQAFADVDVGVPRGMSLERTETLSKEIAERVRTVLPHADVVVHTSPHAAESESAIDAAIIVAARLGVGVHHVRAFIAPDGLKLDMHMEVPSSMALADAHREADRLEGELRGEIPDLKHLEIHIEPRHHEFHELTSGDTESVTAQVLAAARTQAPEGIHNIEVLEGKHGYVVSLHCYLPADMPIAEAHAKTAEIEKAIREQVASVYRITVHPEPATES